MNSSTQIRAYLERQAALSEKLRPFLGVFSDIVLKCGKCGRTITAGNLHDDDAMPQWSGSSHVFIDGKTTRAGAPQSRGLRRELFTPRPSTAVVYSKGSLPEDFFYGDRAATGAGPQHVFVCHKGKCGARYTVGVIAQGEAILTKAAAVARGKKLVLRLGSGFDLG